VLAANGAKLRCADQSLQPLFDRLFNLSEESENGDIAVQRLLIRSPKQGPTMLAALIIGLKPRSKEGLEEFRRRHLVFAALRALAATRDHNLLVLCQDLVLRENHIPLLRATLIAAADLDPIMAGRLAVTLALPAAQHSPRGASDPLIRSMALGILAERCGGLATEDAKKAFATAVTNGTFPEALQAMRLFPHALEAVPMAGLALDRTMEECKSGCADSKVPLFLQALETFDARQDPQRGLLLLKKLDGADRIYVSAIARAAAGGRLSLAPPEDIVAYAAKRLSEGSESEQDAWADLLLSWDPQRLISLLGADDPRSIRARARLDRPQTPVPPKVESKDQNR
jgi:hypothetical protein